MTYNISTTLGWTLGIVTVLAVVVGPIAPALPLVDVLVESEAFLALLKCSCSEISDPTRTSECLVSSDCVVLSHHKVSDAIGAGAVLAAARLQLDVDQIGRAVDGTGHQGRVSRHVV